VDERFVISKSILDGEGKSIVCQTFPKLPRGAFRLPGFDEDKGVFFSNTFAWIIGCLYLEMLFVPTCIYKPDTTGTQGTYPLLPGAKHRDIESCLGKPRGKQAGQRACADD
jgi:hypothetical protein